MPTNRQISIAEEAELARRAIRGAAAFEVIGYSDPAAARAQQAAAQASGLQHAVINISAPGTYPIIPAVSGQRIRVFTFFLWSEVDQDLELFDGTLTLTGPLSSWAMQTGLLLPYTGEAYFELSSGNAFNLTISAAGQVSGFAKFSQG